MDIHKKIDQFNFNMTLQYQLRKEHDICNWKHYFLQQFKYLNMLFW